MRRMMSPRALLHFYFSFAAILTVDIGDFLQNKP